MTIERVACPTCGVTPCECHKRHALICAKAGCMNKASDGFFCKQHLSEERQIEQRTSNPGFELRATAAALDADHWPAVAGRKLREAAAEIERLTAENDKLKLQVWGGEMSEVQRLTAELASVTNQADAARIAWDNSHRMMLRAEAERDRLREEMKLVIDGEICSHCTERIHEIHRLRAGLIDLRERLSRGLEIGPADIDAVLLGISDSAAVGPGPCGFSNEYGRCILMLGHNGKHELQ